MINKEKLPVLILIIVIGISLIIIGGLAFSFQKEHVKNLALQEDLEEIKTRQRITETKLQESKNTISALETKLQDAKNQIDSLTNELQQEKVSKQTMVSEMQSLKNDLEQQKRLRSDLETKLTQAQEDTKRMEIRLSDLETKRNELEVKIDELRAQAEQSQSKGVELGTIIVGTETGRPTAAKAAAPAKPVSPKQQAKVRPEKEQPRQRAVEGSEGKILVVNRDYNFAVINLGSKDNVAVGDIFSVYHNEKLVGDINIEKVHDSMSAAGFTSTEMKNSINEGDKVIKKTK